MNNPTAVVLDWEPDTDPGARWKAQTSRDGFTVKVYILDDDPDGCECCETDCDCVTVVVSAVASLDDVDLAMAGVGDTHADPAIYPGNAIGEAVKWAAEHVIREAVDDARAVLTRLVDKAAAELGICSSPSIAAERALRGGQ